MLVQFALIVFALFAMLSLIIDVGYARITQAQMQNAADTAALEGVRKRNVGVVNPATGQTVDDAYAADCLRRASAHRLAGLTFDDDLDVANGDPDFQFGAGPIIDLTGGATSLHALQTISAPDVHVYKPDLQMNQQNQVHGDMVSGRFCYSADPAASEGLEFADPSTIVCTDPQRADDTYARNDFNPNSAAPQPPVSLGACPPADDAPPDPWPLGGTGSLSGVDDSAFLVRMRRSNELQDFGQTETDVASSGPSLPLVFGRGTTIFGDDPSGGYSVRRDGLTVRATAIAEVRPALHVGVPQTNPSMPGATPYSLRDTFVQALNAVGAPATINPANGVICIGVVPPAAIGTCIAAAPNAVGRFVADRTAMSTVGQALPAGAPTACVLATTLPNGFAPVYSLMTTGANRVIGFTRIGLQLDPARPPNAVACPVRIVHGASQVAASNATAVLTTALPLPAAAQPADVTELLDKHLVRNGAVDYAPVLAPALVR